VKRLSRSYAISKSNWDINFSFLSASKGGGGGGCAPAPTIREMSCTRVEEVYTGSGLRNSGLCRRYSHVCGFLAGRIRLEDCVACKEPTEGTHELRIVETFDRGTYLDETGHERVGRGSSSISRCFANHAPETYEAMEQLFSNRSPNARPALYGAGPPAPTYSCRPLGKKPPQKSEEPAPGAALELGRGAGISSSCASIAWNGVEFRCYCDRVPPNTGSLAQEVLSSQVQIGSLVRI